jgi:hypothetical protein
VISFAIPARGGARKYDLRALQIEKHMCASSILGRSAKIENEDSQALEAAIAK